MSDPKTEPKKESCRVPIIGIVTAAVFLAAIAAVFFQLSAPAGKLVRIVSDGNLIETIDLSVSPDREIVIENEHGKNIVSVEDHRIRVSEADCPDQTCVKSGFLSGARPIICLPHKLVIEYAGAA
ncbi:MAG: NusG domain II-containing protein [Ruminiclostridium sp.]|nr:NusG domain II-containing protein [Ruminiclostridium sp.]